MISRSPFRPSPRHAIVPLFAFPVAQGPADEVGCAPPLRTLAERAEGAGAPPTPRVAVLGAGPAGLVAAKYAADAGLAPTVFDRAQHVGGAWNPQNSPRWPTFRANLSRLACQFSGHPWDDGAPLFPSQAEVGRYLATFCRDQVAARSEWELGAEIAQ